MLLRDSRIVGTASSCVLLLLAASVDARPCNRVSADRAVSESVLILKGSLISTATVGAPGSDSTSVIHVDRVLKGHSTRRDVTVTHFLCGVEYSQAMRKGRPLIVFVDGSGGLVGGTAVLPASARGAADGSTDTKARLRSELLLAATDEDAITARAAVGALAELDGAESTTTLNQAVTSAAFGTRVRALTWLTRFGDANAFEQLVTILSAPPFTPSTVPTTIRDDQSASIAVAHDDILRMLWSLATKKPNVPANPSAEPSRFVQTMMTVARSEDAGIREVAIHALRAFDDPTSFSVLADALADPNRHIRYNAMVTLCMAMKAPDLPCPSVPLFERDEQKYIGRVRAWWNNRR